MRTPMSVASLLCVLALSASAQTKTSGKLSCDTSIAKLGDACDKKLEGQAFSCASDAASILVCRDGRFALDQACKTGQKCAVDGTTTHCVK